MIETLNQYSHLTAKERDNPSLPVRMLLEKKLIIGKVLDFGCGFGKDVEFLKSKNIDCQGFDPYYFPDEPKEKFDTILCFYVLNVLFPEEQNKVIMEVSRFLKPTGKAYFVVRRDIQKDGFRLHHLHGKQTYQCFVKLPFKSIFLNENTEFYEYQHFNQILDNQGKCPFCKPKSSLTLITETVLSYAILDAYPVSKGHALVIPKRHISNYFELSFEEQKDCWQLSNFVQSVVNKAFSPDGFNVGINIGKSAGQKMNHVGIHIIPRYLNDGSKKTGIRHIL